MSSHYCIRVKGHLRPTCAKWFDRLTIIRDGYGETTLSGLKQDEAAQHGLLAKVRDLNLTLISVAPVKPEAS